MLFNIFQDQVAFRLDSWEECNSRSDRIYYDLFEEESWEESGNKNYIYIYL